MKIKSLKKLLAVLCAALALTFGGISAEAVKPRPMATIGMVEVLDRCNVQLDLIKDIIKDQNLKAQLANAPKNKDLIEEIESTLKPLGNLYVDYLDDAKSLKKSLRRLYVEILALKNYFHNSQINDENTVRNIEKVMIKCAAVSFIKARILINAEALAM